MTMPPSPPLMKNSAAAPTVFFDVAPSFGVVNGIMMIELAAPVVLPKPDGSCSFDVVCVGHLRCSPQALGSLKAAIDQLLAMTQAPAIKN